MSWPLASFLVVGVVLALGWLAYERARPSARMVAVVGTLAAVAALGRDAFVAIARRQADHRDDARRRLRARAAARLQRRRAGHARVELRARPGPLHAVADGRLGPGRSRRRGARRAQLAAPGPRAAGARLRAGRVRRQGDHERLPVDARRQPHARGAAGGRRHGAAVSTSPTRSPASCSASPSAPSWRGCWRACARGWTSAGSRRRAAPRRCAARRCHLAAGCARSARRGGVALRSRSPWRSARRRRIGGVARRPGVLPRLRAERRRRLRRGARAAQQRAVHRAGRRWAWPRPGATRRACGAAGIRCSTRCAAKRRRCTGVGDAERTILAARACGASPYSFAGRNLVAEVLRARAADGSFAHQVNLTRVCDLRAARRRALAAAQRDSRGGRLARAPAERRRRLRLRRARLAQRTSTTPAPRCRRWPRPARATVACSTSPSAT